MSDGKDFGRDKGKKEAGTEEEKCIFFIKKCKKISYISSYLWVIVGINNEFNFNRLKV